jgi:hypothetical protein
MKLLIMQFCKVHHKYKYIPHFYRVALRCDLLVFI